MDFVVLSTSHFNGVVNRFIHDCTYNKIMVDRSRYIALSGVIRFAYLIGLISYSEQNDLFQRLYDLVVDLFDNDVPDPYDFFL